MSTTERGNILLRHARNAIAERLHLAAPLQESADWLQEPGATFVTLTQNDLLRGCIGSLVAHRPLLQDVRANAVAAAFHDPRFPPLQAEELAGTRLEVSLLSPQAALSFKDEDDLLRQLRPQVDGVVFEYGHHRSTFLPQVWEQLPDPHIFMAHLKRKAGLAATFWAPGIRVARYTVEKWKENSA